MRSLFDINEKPEVVNIVVFSLNFLVAKFLHASVSWNMRASVSGKSLSCIAVSLVNGGKIKDFAKAFRNQILVAFD